MGNLMPSMWCWTDSHHLCSLEWASATTGWSLVPHPWVTVYIWSRRNQVMKWKMNLLTIFGCFLGVRFLCSHDWIKWEDYTKMSWSKCFEHYPGQSKWGNCEESSSPSLFVIYLVHSQGIQGEVSKSLLCQQFQNVVYCIHVGFEMQKSVIFVIYICSVQCILGVLACLFIFHFTPFFSTSFSFIFQKIFLDNDATEQSN